MKKHLISCLSLCARCVLSLSLLLWSLTIASHLYSLMWILLDRANRPENLVEDGFANLVVMVIAAAFLKMSWDGLTGFRKIKQKSLQQYSEHAHGN